MADLPPSLSSDEDEKINKGEDEIVEDDEMDEAFEFGGILGEDGGGFLEQHSEGWSFRPDRAPERGLPRMNIGDLIAAKRKAMTNSKKKDKGEPNDDERDEKNEVQAHFSDASSNEEDSSDEEDEEEVNKNNEEHKALEGDVLKHRAGKDAAQQSESDDDSEEEDEDEAAEKAKAAEYFQDEETPVTDRVFTELALSRPLLRGVAAMGFVQPTPIQSSVIPLALQGRDVCASAQTGSGKTAAFLLPILERLLHRPSGRTKALILLPTRELAAQCIGMMETFSKFTKITASLIVGGSKNTQAQAAELRARPDLVVATPGRLLDHVTNSASITLDDIEFLCLDEADRLLDLGFQDEIMEIVKSCPVQRQTLLFSATLNHAKVDDLVRLSLKNPLRVRIGETQPLQRLEQEFIRIRSGNEGIHREAVLLALLSRTFPRNCIVFFDRKATAHRLMIICGLLGISCAELHGNLTQQQRLEALEAFRKGDVDVLLATDLAARGLDIDKIETVINFEMPTQLDVYTHRIGRTARAGRCGCSCTLIGEGRRHLMKQVVRNVDNSEMSAVVRSRTVPASVISHFVAKIKEQEDAIEDIKQAEVVAQMDRLAEMEVVRAQNIIEHADEIKARPQKEWFASNAQKKSKKEEILEKKRKIEEAVGTGMHRMTRKKRRAREALKAFANANADDDGNVKKVKINVKADARKEKRKLAEKPIVRVKDEIVEKPKKRSSSIAPEYSLGDGSLFNEDKATFSAKSKEKKGSNEDSVAKSSFHFQGFDPEKKLGKKKGHKKFKSKSKYRRR